MGARRAGSAASHGHFTLEAVRRYYGQVLGGTKDLKTSACCTVDALPGHLKALAAQLHPEVTERFYGCGSPIPPEIEGCTVLDLGCGSGRDAYLLSALVGPAGRVIGLDMTEEQLAVARRHQVWHAKALGQDRSNVDFRQGYIEDLSAAGIADASIDVVISNCVINLSPDKRRVFQEIERVLRPGGELYFSDVFAGRRVPAQLARDPVLLGECLGGALYVEDFRRLMRDVGFMDHRVTVRSPLTVTDPDIALKVGAVDFHSITVRAFKLPGLEDLCEDYGQVAVYKGTIAQAPHFWSLDDHHRFEKGRSMLVCSNTAAMVSQTRFGRHFEVHGDLSVHYGPFNCAPASGSSTAAPSGACC